MKRPSVHVVPWLRPIGGRVIPNWLAITIGRHIFAWRSLTDVELEHELEHARQWARIGWAFPLAYLADSVRVRRRGGRWYDDNRFEREARAAAAGRQQHPRV